MIPLTPSIQKTIQKKRQLDLHAPKTDSRELLLRTAGAINEMVFGCINVQTANMVTIGTGGIHIAARETKAAAHALTINSLRSIHASELPFFNGMTIRATLSALQRFHLFTQFVTSVCEKHFNVVCLIGCNIIHSVFSA